MPLNNVAIYPAVVFFYLNSAVQIQQRIIRAVPGSVQNHGPFHVACGDFPGGVRGFGAVGARKFGEENQYENSLIKHQLFSKRILGEMVSGIAERFIEKTADRHPDSDRRKLV